MSEYSVRSGDTLYQIANANNMSLSELLELNPQFRANPDLIHPGDVVRFSSPAREQAAVASTTGVAAPTAVANYDGGRLSRVQLAQLFHQAGFRGENLVAMVAIAMRESGGDPRAFNGNTATGDQSYGLTQINMLGSLGPARLQQLGLTANEQLFDPLTNARAAFTISNNGTDLSPWGGYKGMSNTYNTDMAAARAAVAQAEAQGLLGQPFQNGASAGPAAAPAAGTAPANAGASQPVLRIGARGADVTDLQTRLRDAGFSPGPVDGWFGPQTQAAVRQFQASRGIVVDGWVGPQTWGQLLPTGDSPPGGARLVQGASGAAVKELQQMLQTLGYYQANVGGNFGPLTDTAVRAFQRNHGLTVDGWAGPQTMAALRNAVASRRSDTPPPGDGGPRPTTEATTPAQGVEPVTSGPRAPRVRAAIDYALYWATQEQTAYSGGASPYRFGGVGNGGHAQQAGQSTYLSPQGMVCFDCSGLVVAMYRQAGIDLAATDIVNTREMAARLPSVPKDQLQPGDLLVKAGSHVVIYLGDVTGDGRPDVVEATPYGPNPRDGSVPVAGVRINDASGFVGDGDYVGRRVALG